MQADSITLSVDTLNNGSPTNQTFTNVLRDVNKSTYNRTDGTTALRREMTFLRKFAVRSGNFNGATKVTVKFTDTTTVPAADDAEATVSCLLVGEVSFSIPLGVSAAAQKEFRQRLVAALDNDTIMDKLMDRGEV